MEVLNISAQPVDLQGVSFGSGLTTRAIIGGVRELAPGARALYVAEGEAFVMRYGAGLPIAGEFILGSNLSNDGERLTLLASDSSQIVNLVYGINAPWPSTDGKSIVLMNPATSDASTGSNWRQSTAANGAPALDDRLRYSAWQVLHFPTDEPGSAVDGAPRADPDGDGLENLTEFFFGSSPRYSTHHSVLPAVAQFPAVSDGVEQVYPGFSFRYLRAAEEVAFVPETSADLGVWGQEGLMLSGAPIDHGDGTESRSYRSIQPLRAGDRRFFRLRLELR